MESRQKRDSTTLYLDAHARRKESENQANLVTNMARLRVHDKNVKQIFPVNFLNTFRRSGSAAEAPGGRVCFLDTGFAQGDPGVKQAALGCRGGDAQLAGGFADRTFLQLANFNGRANSRTERTENVSEQAGPLALGIAFLGIERSVHEMKARMLLPFLIREFHGHFARVASTAEFHQRGVDGDSGEPGGQLRPAVKIIQVQQAAQEAVLEGGFGILAIPGDTQGGAE